MKRKRFSEEQIIAILTSVSAFCSILPDISAFAGIVLPRPSWPRTAPRSCLGPIHLELKAQALSPVLIVLERAGHTFDHVSQRTRFSFCAAPRNIGPISGMVQGTYRTRPRNR